MLDGADIGELAESLYKLCRDIADGGETLAEKNGYYDIAIFKDGVTL